MVSFLLFVYFVNKFLAVQSQSSLSSNTETPSGSLTETSTGASILSPKPVMCTFRGNMDTSNPDLLNLDPIDIPCECEVIVYSRFSIDMASSLDVDCVLLDKVLSLNRPVLVELHRQVGYFDWVDLLKPDGQYEETNKLREFALTHKIKGFLLTELTPSNMYQTFNGNISQYIPSYITQLKGDSDLIIGLSIQAFAPYIKNVCVYNFAELNKIVDYYEVNTIGINNCNPDLYNGRVPIKASKRGPNYYLGMQEVTEFLKSTQIDMDKIVYVIEMFPFNLNSEEYSSYHQVCIKQYDCTSWCIQNTLDFFNKGAYAREQIAGCVVVFFEFDDIKDECGCGAFIGLKNVAAGFYGGQHTACPDFDVQHSKLLE